MDTPSIFFLVIFAVPLVVLLFWVIRKDTHYRKWGYLALTAMLLVALYVAFFKAPSFEQLFPNA